MHRELARAKINLNLHIGQVIDDPAHRHHGYHPLSSLVVFADYGDELSCETSQKTSLEITGPFSKGLETDESNLILKAYQRVADQVEIPKLKFNLVKNLPIASGIGGGSADAAAALRLLQNYVNLNDHDWHSIALSLGADVPVCFYSKTCIMKGIGEQIEFLENRDNLHAVLVNAGVSKIRCLEDGWTIITEDEKNSAHFEHTVLVGKEEPEILTMRPRTALPEQLKISLD